MNSKDSNRRSKNVRRPAKPLRRDFLKASLASSAAISIGASLPSMLCGAGNPLAGGPPPLTPPRLLNAAGK